MMVRILSLGGLPKKGQPLPYYPITAGAVLPWGLLPSSVASEQIAQAAFGEKPIRQSLVA